MALGTSFAFWICSSQFRNSHSHSLHGATVLVELWPPHIFYVRFRDRKFLQGRVVSPTPNPQPEGPWGFLLILVEIFNFGFRLRKNNRRFPTCVSARENHAWGIRSKGIPRHPGNQWGILCVDIITQPSRHHRPCPAQSCTPVNCDVT
jgi:hypothetical protein